MKINGLLLPVVLIGFLSYVGYENRRAMKEVKVAEENLVIAAFNYAHNVCSDVFFDPLSGHKDKLANGYVNPVQIMTNAGSLHYIIDPAGLDQNVDNVYRGLPSAIKTPTFDNTVSRNLGECKAGLELAIQLARQSRTDYLFTEVY